MREPLVVGLVGSLLFGLLGCSAEESSVSSPPAASSSANTNAAPLVPTAEASAAPLNSAEKDKSVPVPEGMAYIPAGIFLMGAPNLRGNPDEKPAHEAIVASFFLDKYEVAHGAFMKCVKAGSCKVPRLDHMYCNVKLQLKGATDRDKYPANCIDLMHADSYCRWAGKRLPTEREWEYAATGGDRRTYSWGEELPTKTNCCYDNPGSCVGGSFEAGAFGLYDMTGNVWEWTSSQFHPYPSPPRDVALSRYRHYVYRGGSWSRRFPKWMRTMLRNRYKPDEFSASIGVRCAQTVRPLVCPANSEEMFGASQDIPFGTRPAVSMAGIGPLLRHRTPGAAQDRRRCLRARRHQRVQPRAKLP
jgi:formylglycine-generating enzyme required for sulfatase activity